MTGFVYAIECNGRIKLGYSEYPEKRVNKVASDAPFPCVLLGYWPGTVADELDVQTKFQSVRVHGEWFAATAHYDHGELKGRWRDLPVGSFAEAGTNIPTGLMIFGRAA